MMLRSVFAKTLRDARSTLLWWSVALVGVVSIYLGGYQQYVQAGYMNLEIPEFLVAVMGELDFASGAGYVNATVYSLLGSVLMVIFSLSSGSYAVAGEEEAGMLDIILAHPVSRTRFVLERFAALVVLIATLGIVLWISVVVASRLAAMDIPISNIAAASAGLTLLGIVFGTLALAAGALTGRRGPATGITAAVALATFLANNLGGMFEGLGALQQLSPFYYYLGGDPLRQGFDPAGLAVLAAAALLLLGLAVWGLNRRDVSV